MSAKVGIVGSRGMVGQVLMERMHVEGDFKYIQPTFFSTSQKDQTVVLPFQHGEEGHVYHDAYDLKSLLKMDIILTCQGSDYTGRIHSELRQKGWEGYWIDAASYLRMKENAVIVLDPINSSIMKSAIKNGIKDFIGGNCTVSLMLLALQGLISENLIEWISAMTYQAASGAGASHMKELVSQMKAIGHYEQTETALALNKKLQELYLSEDFPKKHFGVPLAGSLIPWIDSDLGNGQSKEEWKAMAEGNKILGFKNGQEIPIDGTCVRVGAMRCHSQALTIKLKHDLAIEEIEKKIRNGNSWVKLVPNNKEDTIRELSPVAVDGSLVIAIGRLKKMNIGPTYLSAFTVGDQLLWGAAEPLRRTLRMLLDSYNLV